MLRAVLKYTGLSFLDICFVLSAPSTFSYNGRDVCVVMKVLSLVKYEGFPYIMSSVPPALPYPDKLQLTSPFQKQYTAFIYFAGKMVCAKIISV